MELGLRHKVAVVTGASRGIGKPVAPSLLDA
jgi:NAD(P)-dependent dehydrogenase (short-subunit alcohol dehydrogenase family)